MAIFDENEFMNSTYSDATSTKRPVLPVGEYTGQVGELKVRSVQGKKDPSKTFTFLDLPLKVDLPDHVRQEIGANSNTWTLNGISVSLDLDNNGKMDMREGRNINLGRLRASAGQNEAGKSWKILDLQGARVKFVISHRFDDDNNAREEIKAWLPAS